MSTPPQHTEGWEPKDVNVPAMYVIALVVVMSAVVCALASGALFRALSIRKNATDAPAPAMARVVVEQPAEPRLQVAPRVDYGTYRAEQEKALQTYGWLDREHGIVRIPIQRAMDLLIQRGLPATPPSGSDLQFRQTQGGGKAP